MLKKNLLILKKKFPKLADRIESLEIPTNYFLKETKTGSFSLKIDENPPFYPHSPYNPEKEAIEFIEKSLDNLHENNVILILGFGLGYHVIELLKHIKDDKKILIFDSDSAMFKSALSIIDFSSLFSRNNIELLIGEDLDMVYEKVSKMFKIYENKSIDIIEFERITKRKIAFYTGIREKLKAVISVGVSNFTTVVRHLDTWHSHIFKNIKFMTEGSGVLELKDSFHSKPVFIVSAGPSLDKNFKLLKKIKGKHLIITVDTAYKILLNKGIIPDIVVSVDGQAENYVHMKGIEREDVALVASPIVYPDTISTFKGKKFFFNFHFALSIWIEQNFRKMGMLQPGGSVATIAFDLARLCGADPIIFVGQDLAFSDMKTHATGNSWEERNFKEIDRFHTIESIEYERIFFSPKTVIPELDIYGNKIYTYRVMKDYANWFFYEFGHTNSKIINATEGGILRKNVEIMNLSEAINLCSGLECDVKKIISDHFRPSSKEQIINMENKLAEIKKNLTEIIPISEQGMKIGRQLISAYNSKDSDRIVRLKGKISEISQKIEILSSKISFFSYSFQKEYWPQLRFINNNSSSYKDDNEKELIIIRTQYESVNKAASKLLTLIKNYFNLYG